MYKLSATSQPDTTLFWQISLVVALTAVIMLLPEMSMAAEAPGKIGTAICNVVGWFTGKVGAGIGTLAIIVIGLGALMGKVSWGMAILVFVGIAIIFGAGEVLHALDVGGTATCSGA